VFGASPGTVKTVSLARTSLAESSAGIDVIAIIDYGMGNVGSMANMLKRVGADATITSDHDVIATADKLILPGVGAFDNGMRELANRNLVAVLNEQVLEKGKSILGVCLGMHLFTRGSEEGSAPGLGWLPAQAVRLRPTPGSGAVKVPHMGWNTAPAVHPDLLFDGLDAESRFYFVHSFHVTCDDGSVLARTEYGDPFVSAIRRGNIAGVQFHPEKSHRFGLRLLRNFAERG
jgi:glutamine amidotransferase